MSWEDHQERTFKDASTKDSMLDPVESSRTNFILDNVGTGKVILDIGANHGDLSDEMRKKGNLVCAMDLPGVVNASIDSFPRLHWIGASAEEPLPFGPDMFDVVVAAELVEHLINIDGFMKEVMRVLRPGGIFLVTTPNVARPYNVCQMIAGKDVSGFFHHEESPLHIRFYTWTTLGNLLHKHGFDVIYFCGANTGNDGLARGLFSQEEEEQIMKLMLKHRRCDAELSSILCFKAKKPGIVGGDLV